MTTKDCLLSAKKDVETAERAEEQGNTSIAIDYLRRSLKHYRIAVKHEHSTQVKYTLTQHTNNIMDKITVLEQLERDSNGKRLVDDKRPEVECGGGGGGNGGSDGEGGGDSEKKGHALSNLIMTEEELPGTTWDDVIGLEMVKEIFKENVQYPLEMPQIFTGNRQPSRSILLYGPPGVGKTLIVRALAHECGIAFISVSSADIINKFVGDSAKNIRALFDVIRAAKPCIVFIDEIESLCGDRDSGNGNQHSGESLRVVDEFLTQFDGITKGGDMSNVLLIGATNYPWKLDRAVLRRLELRIYIPLPENNDRLLLLKHLISRNGDDIGQPIPEKALEEIALSTKLFSSSDLTNLIKEAYRQSAREILKAQYFCRLLTNPEDKQSYIYLPYTQGEDEHLQGIVKNIRYEDIAQKSRIRSKAIRLDHILSALNRIKPSIDENGLKVFEEWTLKHGTTALSS